MIEIELVDFEGDLFKEWSNDMPYSVICGSNGERHRIIIKYKDDSHINVEFTTKKDLISVYEAIKNAIIRKESTDIEGIGFVRVSE